MDFITVTVAFCVLLFSSTALGDYLKLSFDTQIYDNTDDYYAHIGEEVTLTCCVPSTVTKVNMYKGTSLEDYDTLVSNGEPQSYVTSRKDKYSFESSGGKYQLTIYKLEKSDSLYYSCIICKFVLFGYCIPDETKFVYLDVKMTSDESEIPEFCDLVNNTFGIFFTGNDLILRCPKVPSGLETSNGSSTFSVDFDIKSVGTVFNLLTIKNLTENFNGTMIRCIYANGDMNKDYCSHLPRIIVFNNIAIKLSPENRHIESGENKAFTCHSHPFLPLSSQWNISDDYVTFDNVTVSEIPQGSRLTINNIKFSSKPISSSSPLLTVTCTVMIGSQKSVKMASVYPKMQDISTMRATSLVSENSSIQTAVDTTMSNSGSDEIISSVFVVVPVIVGIIALGIVVLGLFYIKLRKRSASNEGPQNMSTKQGVVNVTEIAYDTRNNQKKELGLTNNDSEVVENVAYASYDEDYKQC